MLSVAMAMRKTGAIELMTWTGNPRPIRRPMLHIMLIIATIIIDMARERFLNMRYMAANMIIPAIGENIPISLNMTAPNVSLATGSPAM